MFVFDKKFARNWMIYDTFFSLAAIKVNSRVPGSIYTDLNRAGILEGDLYDNFNDVKYRWVSYDNWTFTKQFDGTLACTLADFPPN